MLKAQRRREALQQQNGADGRGRYEEAIAEFDLALFSDGSMAAAFHNRALAEQRTGSLSSAIKDYTRSIELDPELALASQNRASAYLDPGDRQSALADLERSLELDDQSAAAQTQLVWFFWTWAKVKRRLLPWIAPSN